MFHYKVSYVRVVTLQRAPKYSRGLLDDVHVGNDVDYACLSMADRVVECERQRRESFTATGGHGQSEQSGRLPRLFSDMVQHLAA